MLSSFTWSNFSEFPVEEECHATHTLTLKQNRKQHVKWMSRNVSSLFKPQFQYALDRLHENGVKPLYSEFSIRSVIDWNRIPFAVSVLGGHIPAERAWRKNVQVENMMSICNSMIAHLASSRTSQGAAVSNNPIIVCEFCAGSGFVALPLAALWPDVHFILIDAKVCNLPFPDLK
jgi:hypothetical protein